MVRPFVAWGCKLTGEQKGKNSEAGQRKIATESVYLDQYYTQ